jgi:hypothetical protein
MIRQLSWRLSISAGVLAARAGNAPAQTTNCSGMLPTGSYDSPTVTAGQTCIIGGSSVTVSGNVTVGRGTELVIVSPCLPLPITPTLAVLGSQPLGILANVG